MIILVTGGSGSGKSEFAENCCMKLPAVEKRYIATMQAYDEESRARIRKHQNARSGKGFSTVEQGRCFTPKRMHGIAGVYVKSGGE